MRVMLLALAAAAIPLSAPLSAYGHPGGSSYDASKPIKITAPIDEVTWSNPHSMMWVNHEGKRTEVYLAPISRMVDRGLQKEALAVGKTVTIEAYPSTANAAEMRAERITVDGKTVELR